MMKRSRKLKLLFCALLFYIFQYFPTKAWLLYPGNTVFQITVALTMPLELPKDMRFIFDWGFQVNYDLPNQLGSFYNISKWPRSFDYSKYNPQHDTHPSDATAGEIYTILEDLMFDAGYHETCLLKSVCELAQHPMEIEEENLLGEVIQFALSPSKHKAFAANENAYKHAYEAAERYGASGIDCNYLYPECPTAIINAFTKVLYDSAYD